MFDNNSASIDNPCTYISCTVLNRSVLIPIEEPLTVPFPPFINDAGNYGEMPLFLL